MDNINNLTEGKIRSTLIKLALPTMGTGFIQMAYNLTDILWLGRLSTEAVAAAGAAGFFLWLATSLAMISQVGVGVNVAQCNGKGNIEIAKKYISNGFHLDVLIALIYSLIILLFRHQLIGFFDLQDENVIEMAVDYLTVIGVGVIFHFLNPVFSAILNSSGDSLTPFKANTIGLISNIVIDPILIFGIGPFPAMGIKGAALATILAQFFVSMIFIFIGKTKGTIYSHIKLIAKPDMKIIKNIVKIGTPPAFQSAIHASINMVITKIIATFGPVAVAVQSVGSQIESITWMTADGFSAAMSAFTGQNYGAGKIDRIKEGYKQGMLMLGCIGIFTTLLLVLGAESLFTLFIPNDPVAIIEGVNYLRILGFSQFLMGIEIGTAGAFNGLGKSLPPTINGVVLNILRIPMAMILSSTKLGLSGVWLSLNISSNLKGIILFLLFRRTLKNLSYEPKEMFL